MDEEDKGYVRINGRRVLIKKAELLSLLEASRLKAKEDYLEKRFNSDYIADIQSLLNGVFVAEGSWSGSFHSNTSHRFTPKFSVGQNASDDSIKLFSLLWAILGCKLVWNISKTSKLNFHIQLVSTNFGYIVNTLIPYFSLTYGEKFTAVSKLLRLYELSNIDTVAAKFETICLVYSLTSQGKNRFVSLKEKLVSSIGEGSPGEQPTVDLSQSKHSR